MSKIACLFLFFNTLISAVCLSQFSNSNQAKTDSLMKEYYQTDSVELKIRIMRRMAWYNLSDSAKSLDLLRRALDLAEEHSLTKEISVLNFSIGGIYTNYNNYRAKKYLMRALTAAEEINFNAGISNAHNALGIFYYDSGAYDLSIKHYLTAEKGFLIEKNESKLASTYNNIAITYRRMGDNAKALEYHYEALRIRQEHVQSLIPRSLFNIGNIYRDLQKYSQAETYYSRALELIPPDKKALLRAKLHSSLGAIHLHSQSTTEPTAFELISLALITYQKFDDAEGIAKCYHLLGKIYLQQNSFDSARTYFVASQKILAEKNVLRPKLESDIEYTRYLLKVDSLERAVDILENCLSVAIERGFHTVESEALQRLYEVERKRANYEKALQYLEKSTALKDSIDNRLIQSRINLITTKINENIIEAKATLSSNQMEQPQENNHLHLILASIVSFLAISFLIFRIRNQRNERHLAKKTA